MRRIMIALMATILAACGDAPPATENSEAQPANATNFPKAGSYHVIADYSAGDTANRSERNQDVDVSTREKFEQFVDAGFQTGSCRDHHVDIGGGSFSVTRTCSGPDGDVRYDTHGSYSSDSIDLTRDISAPNGETVSSTSSYRLQS